MLEGKVAFITGASMGIGSGIARVFSQEGAKLVLAARSAKTEQLARELSKTGPEAIGVSMDVTSRASIKAAVQRAVEHFGTIDILVNNAGVCRLGPFETMNDEDRDFHFEVNIKGVWNVTREVLPFLKGKQGKIVIMSSVTGDMVADPGEVAYATSKAALVGFTKSLAVELAPLGITVNAICPGYVLTPMAEAIAQQSTAENPDAVLRGIANAVPLKRLADHPTEVGHLAAFLASPGAAYITGTQVVIDGGSTLPETVSVGI
jgi:NAD(P)-dependent dehydrogenase (short-subunit alcohol dehydrogenase family)